ncbi:hypothetical protein D3C78_1721040 [compost metagenome]
MPWYSYNPVDAFPHDACNPNSYTNVGNTPPSCPSPNNHLCAIQANDNAGKPIFTRALLCEIVTALNNRVDTTNVQLRPNLV